MATQIDKAIVKLWDAATLNSEIPGGIWKDEAPPKTPFPYCCYSMVSVVPRFWTSSGEFRQHQFQFQVYHKEDNVNDPNEAVGNLLDIIRDLYDDANMVLDANKGYVMLVRRVPGEIILREDDGVWSGTLTYRAERKIDKPPS